MILTLQFIGLWALAFLTLALALVLLNIFDNVIGNDLVLHSLQKEAIIAGVASLIEGASVWAVISFIPAGVRGLFIPAIIVAILYKVSHLEHWSRYDVMLLLLFQLVLGVAGATMLAGHVGGGFLILVVCGGLFTMAAVFLRDI